MDFFDELKKGSHAERRGILFAYLVRAITVYVLPVLFM